MPQGGNTGLVGGQTPHNGEVVLSLKRLDRIREVDPTSNTMTCEAGVILMKAQEAAAAAGRLFPLSLGAEGSCTIGGNLSTNAGGTGALAYGVARELVLGLEVVLADGRVLNNLRKLKKDNTGYDLRHLFVGAEGTLGIITAAVLRLFPRPRAVETAFIGVPSPHAALALLNLAEERAGGIGDELRADPAHRARIRGQARADVPRSARRPASLVRADGAVVAGARGPARHHGGHPDDRRRAPLIEDATIAESLDQTKAFWLLRHHIADTQKYEGGSIKHDVSVPVNAVPDFIVEATAAVEAMIPGCRPCRSAISATATSTTTSASRSAPTARNSSTRWDEVNDAVFAIVAKHGGSISAEHGIGVMKRDLLPEREGPGRVRADAQLQAHARPEGHSQSGQGAVGRLVKTATPAGRPSSARVAGFAGGAATERRLPAAV